MKSTAVILLASWAGALGDLRGNSAELLTTERLAEMQTLLSPAEGESLFRTITWHTDFWEARKIAAAEGKPIFIWAGSGGGPVGVC